MKKIYIAGKITGMETKAFKLFQDTEKKCIYEGYEVVNPMKLNHDHDKKWISYMRECYKEMSTCTHIYLLPNWKDSKGATDEVIHAIQLGLTFVNVDSNCFQYWYKELKTKMVDKINKLDRAVFVYGPTYPISKLEQIQDGVNSFCNYQSVYVKRELRHQFSFAIHNEMLSRKITTWEVKTAGKLRTIKYQRVK
jgi:hypothetical protein